LGWPNETGLEGPDKSGLDGTVRNLGRQR